MVGRAVAVVAAEEVVVAAVGAAGLATGVDQFEATGQKDRRNWETVDG